MCYSHRESGDYPPGAEFDPKAPYNEPIIPSIDVEVLVSQTFSKPMTITTDNYIEYADGHRDFSDTNFNEEVKKNVTIVEILQAIPSLYQDAIDKQVDKSILYKLKMLAEECKGWNCDESETVLND